MQRNFGLTEGSLPLASWLHAQRGTVTLDARLRESERPHEWRDDFRERAAAYVAGTCHDGWEAHEAVVARFDAAIREHSPEIVVTHGQAMTLWFASVGAIRDPAAFWGELVFPHVYVL